MCCRYYIEPEDVKLEQIGDATLNTPLYERFMQRMARPLKTRGEIRPADLAPVIASSRKGHKAYYPMQWGFNHPKRGMLVFNTRMETAQERGMLAGSVDDRRCLIPASCYYEWKKIDPNRKERYAFRAEDGSPLYMAGLYIRTSDPLRLPCFTILTQDADRSIKDLHPRMPVLVPYGRAEEWLSPDTDFHGLIRQLQVRVVPELG